MSNSNRELKDQTSMPSFPFHFASNNLSNSFFSATISLGRQLVVEESNSDPIKMLQFEFKT